MFTDVSGFHHGETAPRRRWRHRLVWAVVALLGLGAATPAAAVGGHTVQTLHFLVRVGPQADQPCDVVGDLYTPVTADAAHPAPAVLTTNGWGGSKADQAPYAAWLAGQGYVVLAYSGLGWGGSGCAISLDNPDYDGRAASDLVSFLGGTSGIAFLDAAHTQPVPPPDDVVKDPVDHRGTSRGDDPRVGMFGISYGGGAQFAAAEVDPRIDTLVPVATWNDLDYSLAPNHARPTRGVTSSTPGNVKWVAWAALGGIADVLSPPSWLTPPSGVLACPNPLNPICGELATNLVTGLLSPQFRQQLTASSMSSFVNRITIPTLLLQGEHDTLFDLDEAAATYQALRRQGTPVKMVWIRPGHDDPTPAPGEFDFTAPDAATQYGSARILGWFDHHLKDKPVGTGPDFAYFRDWIGYSGIATPAYGTAPAYPVGSAATYYLSAGGELVAAPGAPDTDTQAFLTGPAGLPTSLQPPSTLESIARPLFPLVPPVDLPGTHAAWATPTLTAPVDVVGSPTLDVRLSSPTAAVQDLAGPASKLVVFAKIYDVAPDGSQTLITGHVAPARIEDVTRPVHLVLSGMVHRFAAGHRVKVVVAGGDVNYRGGLIPYPVSITSGSRDQALTLPVVGR